MSDTQQVAMLKQLLADSRAENEALREAGEALANSKSEIAWMQAVECWREVAGEPDPIIPGYGSSI